MTNLNWYQRDVHLSQADYFEWKLHIACNLWYSGHRGIPQLPTMFFIHCFSSITSVLWCILWRQSFLYYTSDGHVYICEWCGYLMLRSANSWLRAIIHSAARQATQSCICKVYYLHVKCPPENLEGFTVCVCFFFTFSNEWLGGFCWAFC